MLSIAQEDDLTRNRDELEEIMAKSCVDARRIERLYRADLHNHARIHPTAYEWADAVDALLTKLELQIEKLKDAIYVLYELDDVISSIRDVISNLEHEYYIEESVSGAFWAMHPEDFTRA